MANTPIVWFVKPETVVLDLPEGQWIEVKRSLSVGEESDALAKIVKKINQATGDYEPNLSMMGFTEMESYIVDWSFRDHDNKKIPVSLSAMKQMSRVAKKHIDAVITAHIAAVHEAIDELKNDQDGEITSATISPSAN